MANLDVSLDELIKKSSNSRRGGRGRGAPHPHQGNPRSLRRPAPYPTPPSSASAKYGVYTDHQIAAAAASSRVAAIETGTKLYISNLDYGVSNEDIKELFSEVGDIKRYSINYDRSGRSKGTAEVVYAKKEDALAAIRRYNNVQLDGKPMQIEFIGTNVDVPPLMPVLPSPPPLFPPFPINWTPAHSNAIPKRYHNSHLYQSHQFFITIREPASQATKAPNLYSSTTPFTINLFASSLTILSFSFTKITKWVLKLSVLDINPSNFREKSKLVP
ncbi:RNA and export factor-binding protein [Rhynchospora pubera]|uniref:RNA and export factor-binding protein n=1 Tax=Rhynchospora pubera TaxID=906938 RepID=A0AAV8I089_9POAL|nr:RNA and export factor-binding protein [Rhynchospora pubera]